MHYGRKYWKSLPHGRLPESFPQSQTRQNPGWNRVLRKLWLRYVRRVHKAHTRSWANAVEVANTSWERAKRKGYKRKLNRIRTQKRQKRLGRAR